MADGSGSPVLLDEAGTRIARRTETTLAAPPRRALDGALWAREANRSAVVRFGSGFAFARQNYAPLIVEVTADANSHGLVLFETGQLVELDASLQQVGSWQLALPASALEVGRDGRVWVGLVNQPAPLLQAFDRTGGAARLIPLPSGLVTVLDVLPDGRAGGDHVFVSGHGGEIVEIDSATLQVVQSYDTGAGPASRIDKLELAPDGSVWAMTERHVATPGVWRIDPVSGSIDQVLGAGFVSGADSWNLSIDSEGSVYALIGSERVQMGADGEILLREPRSVLNVSEDAGGSFSLRVLDPASDLDGDGAANVAELDAATDPYDPQSRPGFDLDVRFDAPSSGQLTADLRMPTGLALVALSPFDGSSSPVQLPGILGDLRIGTGQLQVPVATVLQATPSRLSLQLPPLSVGSGVVSLQALALPVFGGAAEFSDEGVARFRSRVVQEVAETFINAGNRDARTSGGRWGSRSAAPAKVGGIGVLGSFDPTLGVQVGPDVWEFSTDDQLFPAGTTLFGEEIRVQDGVFEFTDFVLPAGVTVRFSGGNAAVIRVRGTLQVEGTIDVSGADVPEDGFSGVATPLGGFSWVPATGQAGALGGPGGGAGGQGADGCELDGDPVGHSGAPGESLQVPAFSGYAGLPGLGSTGGRGSGVFPASADAADVTFNFFATVSGMVAAGGGGGGWQSIGATGRAVTSFTSVSSDLGPNALGGEAFVLLEPPIGISSLEHFLVGGAGGGGGGSHPANMLITRVGSSQPMHAGAGGGGGGGAIAFRVGGAVAVGPTGAIRAHGGGASRDLLRTDQGPPAPGGGGSGGSVLLQFDSVSVGSLAGVLDVRGGAGGLMENAGFSGQINRSVGGDGGHGLVRLESGTSTPSPLVLGQVEPASAVRPGALAPLADSDAFSGQQSKFYGLGTPGSLKQLLRYEVRVLVGGVSTVYTDDPANYRPANLPGQPVRLLVQGAELDAAGEVQRLGAWRDLFSGSGGIATDGTTDAVRFMLLFDRNVATDTRVDSVAFFVER